MTSTYPQSSCPCYTRDTETSSVGMGFHPTRSLATTTCSTPPILQSNERVAYYNNIQPATPSISPSTVVPLNTLGLRYDSGYTKVTCPSNIHCPTSYVGRNPKLIDAMRGQQLRLNEPNLTGRVAVGDVEHDEIYSSEFNRYGEPYNNYQDMNTGQIQYYYFKDRGDAYYSPNFVTPADVTYQLFRDPEGNIRPEYPRKSKATYMWNPCKQDQCDSFTHDTLEFRQELMEKQMRKQLESRWTPRWKPAS
jgi:hypothetical protein